MICYPFSVFGRFYVHSCILIHCTFTFGVLNENRYKWVNPVDTMPSIINSLICMGLGQADKAPMYDFQQIY